MNEFDVLSERNFEEFEVENYINTKEELEQLEKIRKSDKEIV